MPPAEADAPESLCAGLAAGKRQGGSRPERVRAGLRDRPSPCPKAASYFLSPIDASFVCPVATIFTKIVIALVGSSVMSLEFML